MTEIIITYTIIAACIAYTIYKMIPKKRPVHNCGSCKECPMQNGCSK